MIGSIYTGAVGAIRSIRGDGDVEDDPDWHDCHCCGASYRSRGPALRCCSERFDDVEEPGAITAPDEHGAVVHHRGWL